MQKNPFISVIIPTYNREKMLSITIDSFLSQDYPDDKLEIIIANNNSTDDTEKIINEYCNQYPDIVKTVLEKRQGVHYARNSAAKISRGEILYYTDDDMIADKSLLKNIVQVFSTNPEVGAATGKILPKWEKEPPDWVIKFCNNGWLSLNDLGEDTIISPYDIGVFSCHQAIRRELFYKSGGFNPENTAGIWIGDGETGLNIKIRKQGYKFAYIEKAVIFHMIPAFRMTQEYFNKRLANQGNCDSYTEYRKHRYNNALLSVNILKYFFMLFMNFIEFCKNKVYKNEIWRVKRARFDYYFSRIKYDYKIMTDKNWQELVLKDNWINE